MLQRDLDNWFSYHSPTPEQVKEYGQIRDKAKEFAELINLLVPESADKTVAMRSLRETVMRVNLAIACYEPKEAQS